MMILPQRLNQGDIVAIISPSWCGPAVFPHIHENGLKVIKQHFGLQIKEMPHARADPSLMKDHPELRAKDVMDAFADKSIKAIFCSIGGDDSIRLLPYLDAAIIKKNPKILMGFSDNTVLTTYLNELNIVSFNGPTTMAGFSQMEQYPATISNCKEVLFSNKEVKFPASDVYSEGYTNWADKANIGGINEKKKNSGREIWFGSGIVEGISAGGCIDVLDFMRGTPYFLTDWSKKILFFETSEEAPTPLAVKRILRSFGIAGILNQLSGIVVGRPRGYTDDLKKQLRESVIDVVCNEFKCTYPIIGNADFGHTDPQFIIPLGVKTKIDVNKKEIVFQSGVQ